jgi:hypothetical protein
MSEHEFNSGANPRRRNDDETDLTSLSEVDPSKYLSAEDLDGKEVTLTITKLTRKKLTAADGSDDPRMVVWFEGKQKRWLTCHTSKKCLIGMFGRNLPTWIGKRVTIHAEEVDAFGKRVPAIRPVGSPDIDRNIVVKTPLFGKPNLTTTMKPTGAKTSTKATQITTSAPAPDWPKPATPSPVLHDGYVPPEIRDEEVPF